MNANGYTRGGKISAANNLYTVLLAVACCLVLITTLIVAVICYAQYGTMFKIP